MRGVTVTVTAKSLAGATAAAAQTHLVRGGGVDEVDVGRAHGRHTLAACRPAPSRCPVSCGSGAHPLRTGSHTVSSLLGLAGADPWPNRPGRAPGGSR